MKNPITLMTIFARIVALGLLLAAGATLVNPVAASNGVLAHRVDIPTTRLLLPQSNAFALLGHSCGGISEQVHVTGFDPASGFPTGEVRLSTTCSTGGIGSTPHTYTAWAAVTWDFAGNVISSVLLPNSLPFNPTFAATDAYGDFIQNVGANACLHVPVPAAPAGVTVAQVGDDFHVSWIPIWVNPNAIASTILTATPINSTAPVLTATVIGPATNAVISTLQPQTTYQITIVNTTLGGAGPASTPINVTTSPATVPPAAPGGLTAHWTVLDPVGPTDTLITTWQAAIPGDSPVDQYLVTITNGDTSGTLTQTVSGTTLSASFTVDWTPNWTVTVKAHNAFGWGPLSSAFHLGGL